MGPLLPVWKVDQHGQEPSRSRRHAGNARVSARGRLRVYLGEQTAPPAASTPAASTPAADALTPMQQLELIDLSQGGRRPRFGRSRKSRSTTQDQPPAEPILLETYLPPGVGLDVPALRRGQVVREHNLISPRAHANQPSGAPLDVQVWIVGSPVDRSVRLLQMRLSGTPEPGTTINIRPGNPWRERPAARLRPPMHEARDVRNT